MRVSRLNVELGRWLERQDVSTHFEYKTRRQFYSPLESLKNSAVAIDMTLERKRNVLPF
jgi:hypothetical protein